MGSLTFSALIAGPARSDMQPENRSSYFSACVEVRDNAEIHARLFTTEGISGERVLTASSHGESYYQYFYCLSIAC